MASRPAASRGGGLTGAHYGMIAFAIVAVVGLGLFVFTLTRVKGAEDEADRLRRDARLHGNPPSYFVNEARARSSNVFGVMSEDLRNIANVITGNADDVGTTIVAKADDLITRIAATKPGTINKGDTLVTALERMNELHTDAQAALAAMTAMADQLQADKDALTAQLRVAEEQYQTQVAALGEQVQQIQQEALDAMSQKDRQLAQVQETLESREQEAQRLDREKLQLQRDRDTDAIAFERQIDELRQQINQFKLSFDPTAILTKADGRVLRAIPGSDVVYVNVGAVDDIKVGMRFEVFSPAGDRATGLDGKATVEVATVMDETSECRVMRRTPGRPIVEGDVVVNIAYERGRKPKFVVRGQFDLDYDGITDWDGLDQIAGIVRQWGGQVVPELDESVDFVVIGLPPTIPQFGPDERVSAVARDQAIQRELDLSEFRDLVTRAQGMGIPVITQGPFLNLVGYASDASMARR